MSENSELDHQLSEADTERFKVREKWQGAVTDGSGFVAVPMALLRLQSKLNLTQTDMLVLINLLAHWWDPDRAVFPRSTTIANRMGISKRTVQRSIRKLAKQGLMTRETVKRRGKAMRSYQFKPLASRLARDVNLSHQIAGMESFGT